MAFYLGLDAGSSGVRAVVLEAGSGEVVGRAGRPYHVPPRARSGTGGSLTSEFDAEQIWWLCVQVIREVLKGCGRRGSIERVGVTGQMHGMLLVSENVRPRSAFIDWRDRRSEAAMPGSSVSFLGRMRELAGPDGFSRSGCGIESGYMGATLFWMSATGSLPGEPCTACFLSDYIVAKLVDRPPITDPTNAGGSGLFDVISRSWDHALVRRLGLPLTVLPPIVPSASRAGSVSAEAATATGLTMGTPVYVACGDNQASFAGSVASREESVLVNIGTGAQVCAYTPEYKRFDGLETRPYLDGGYLAVAAGFGGGRAHAFLRDVFRDIGHTFFHAGEDDDLYEKMNRAAARVPAGAGGLTCEPSFFGSRLEPHGRGAWTGVTDANFSPGHMVRSVLEGIAEQCRRAGDLMVSGGLGHRSRLIAAGTAVRRNPVLQESLARAFRMEVEMPVEPDIAAVGAALVAATGAREFDSLRRASETVRTVRGPSPSRI